VASLKNCDIKLSTEKYYFIYDFIFILDGMTELKTVWQNFYWELNSDLANNHLTGCRWWLWQLHEPNRQHEHVQAESQTLRLILES
jgi:hypothetical protein